MNAGELNEVVAVLKLVPDGADGWGWAEEKNIWAKVKRDSGQARMNLFSRVGLGAKTELFTMRQGGYTLHNALRWRGRHYFITEIRELDRAFCTVETAAIEPTLCTAERPVFGTDEWKRPMELAPELLRFPACVTEKYLGWEQKKPMAVNETTYVLVTPKVVQLYAGDLVRVDLDLGKTPANTLDSAENGGEPKKTAYKVTACHVLDEYKNEYEMTRRADV